LHADICLPWQQGPLFSSIAAAAAAEIRTTRATGIRTVGAPAPTSTVSAWAALGEGKEAGIADADERGFEGGGGLIEVGKVRKEQRASVEVKARGMLTTEVEVKGTVSEWEFVRMGAQCSIHHFLFKPSLRSETMDTQTLLSRSLTTLVAGLNKFYVKGNDKPNALQRKIKNITVYSSSITTHI